MPTASLDDAYITARDWSKQEHKLAVACSRLGISVPQVRFFDPILLESLSLSPRSVAFSIHHIACAHDRAVAANARSATNAFRKVCARLGDVRAERGQMIFRYNNRSFLLLRYQKDYETRNVSQGTGRAPGCKLTMLAESESALQGEIEFFIRTNK